MSKRMLSLLLALLLLLAACTQNQKEELPVVSENESLSGEEPEVVETDDDPNAIPETPDPEPLSMTLEEAQQLLVVGETGIIPIENAEEMVALSVLVQSGDTTHHDKTYVMQNNINISSMAFPPIGGGEFADAMPKFGGTFDGGNYIVTGLTVTIGVANPVGSGLFGAVATGGSVSNLHLTGGEVTGHDSTGGIVGYLEGALTNCSFAGAVTSTGKNIGGVCGRLESGARITDCFTNAQTSGNTQVGGFAGAAVSGSAISNCNSMGSVTAIESPFSSQPSRIGGFIGMQGGEVSSCYSYMEVYTKVASRVVGGFIGYNEGAVTGCYYNSAATENWKDIDANAEGTEYQVTGCTVEEMLDQATYAGWDFDTVWGMQEGRTRGLPHLRAAWDD